MDLNEVVTWTLSRCNHLNHLKQLQSFLIAVGQSQTQFYCFKLVRFCTAQISNLSYARFIFDHLSAPNVYLYTSLITAYASLPNCHAPAFALFRQMLRRGRPLPNHFVYPHVLKVSFPSATKSVHSHLLKSGFGHYQIVETALIDSYSRIGADIGIARQLFDGMSDRNVVAWTAMVSGYARVGDVGNALCLFHEMPERDVPSWNSVIAGCTQNGLFPEAISLFRKMMIAAEQGHVKPNQVTVVCTLSACGHSGMLQLAKGIHAYVYRNGLSADPFVSNALVDLYGKCGNLKEARRVFEITSKKSLTAWNSMINCFALHGQSHSAIALFQEMTLSSGSGIKPDEITFIGLLNACTHAGLVEKGRSYFKSMTEKHGIEPRIEHYGCLVDLLGRAGRFDEALEVTGRMKMEPDEVIWGSLLNACRIYGRADLAEFAVKKLVEIDPSNGGYVAMMANLYGELGKWDNVRKARKMLKERDAYKTPGCSWIEVDNQLHQFYSVDKWHPRAEDIYITLESLICSD